MNSTPAVAARAANQRTQTHTHTQTHTNEPFQATTTHAWATASTRLPSDSESTDLKVLAVHGVEPQRWSLGERRQLIGQRLVGVAVYHARVDVVADHLVSHRVLRHAPRQHAKVLLEHRVVTQPRLVAAHARGRGKHTTEQDTTQSQVKKTHQATTPVRKFAFDTSQAPPLHHTRDIHARSDNGRVLPSWEATS